MLACLCTSWRLDAATIRLFYYEPMPCRIIAATVTNLGTCRERLFSAVFEMCIIGMRREQHWPRRLRCSPRANTNKRDPY
jgi:hypothetical protein